MTSRNALDRKYLVLCCLLIPAFLFLADPDRRLFHTTTLNLFSKASAFGGDFQINERQASSEVDRRIIRRLNSVLKSCGELCDTSRPTRPGPFRALDSNWYFNVSSARVNCNGLYSNKDIDAPRETQDAPSSIPPYLEHLFTLNGRVDVRPQYINQKYLGTIRPLKWTAKKIDDMASLARARKLHGTYGVERANGVMAIFEKLALPGKRVLVIGSEKPWVEACAIASGAAHVMTLEYRPVSVTHPRMSAATPANFARMFLSGKLQRFDVVVSFSSLEHPGLARYGDALNPWGDIISVAKSWCVTKDNGYHVLEVPFSPEKDILYFNAHRSYGPVRTPYLMTNWEEAFPRVTRLNVARVYKRLPARRA